MRTGFLLAAAVVTLASLAQPEEALAGKGRGKSEKVMVCHRGHEIMVSGRAVDAHLAHGDTLGACESEPTCDELDSDSDGADDCSDLCPDTSGEADADGCDCSQRGDCDSDGDGVHDRDDACPGTPEGDEVRADGCTVVTLSAFAGPDVAAVPGDIVDVVGQGSVLTGDCPEGDLVYEWEQVGGDPVDFEFSSPPLTVDTAGSGPEATFRLTVSTPDGSAEATDEFTINVDLDAAVIDYAKCDPATGHCYALALRPDGSRDLQWWDDAKAIANSTYFQGMRGHLATVTSAAERSFLSSVAGNAPAMLGGTDRAEEDVWVWADGPEDGLPIEYLPWAANEPSAEVHWTYPEGDEDYLQHEGRGLNDINGVRWYYIEFEPGW